MPTNLILTPTNQVLTVPTSWADVTLATFCALHAPEPDESRTVAELLCGLEPGALDQLAADDVVYITNLLDFATDPTPVTSLLPTPGLPDPGGLPWGCLVLVQQHLAGLEGRGEVAALPYVLAVYRAQLTWGNTDRVAEIAAALLAAPVTANYADAASFLGRCTQSLSGTSPTKRTKPTSTRPSTRPTRTPRWLLDLGRRFRSTHLPKGAS